MPQEFFQNQFLDVFARYHQEIWPMQIFAYILGIAAMVLVFRKPRHADRIISGILVFLWLWVGIVYQILYYGEIISPARFIGMMFVIQAVFFFVEGVIRMRISFRFANDPYSYAGVLVILYAMVIYPILGTFFSDSYPLSSCSGFTPCSIIIFTFGMLLWTEDWLPGYLVVIPATWSTVGFFISPYLGMSEDIDLFTAGVFSTALILYREWRSNWAVRKQ